MANVCIAVPDVTLSGVGSTYQCAVCAHIWSLTENSGGGKSWEDSSYSFITNESYALMWEMRNKESKKFWKSCSILLFIGSTIGFVLLLVVPMENELIFIEGFFALFLSFAATTYLICRQKILKLPKMYQKYTPLGDFKIPRDWPCLRQDIPAVNISGLRQT